MITPTLVTLFGERENPREYGMEMTRDDVFYGGGLWDNITHIFNQAQQAIGQISVKTPAPGAPGGPAVKAPGFEAMLTNPIVIGGAALVAVLLVMKKKR